MDVVEWLDARGGVARRQDLVRAGFRRGEIERAALRRPSRSWCASPNAPGAVVAAAVAGGRLTCVSAAEHWGLSLLHRPDELHLAVDPHGHAVPRSGQQLHWDLPILPARADSRIASVPDTLAHIARCLPHDEALVVWESAVRRKVVGERELRRIRWGSPAERVLAAEASGLSDSLIETLAVDALRHAGIELRQQVSLLGHPVDALVGSWLVLQFDGQEFHGTPTGRSADAEQDARLMLEGWTVLRFTYADIVQRRQELIDRVRRAMAQGLHLRQR